MSFRIEYIKYTKISQGLKDFLMMTLQY